MELSIGWFLSFCHFYTAAFLSARRNELTKHEIHLSLSLSLSLLHLQKLNYKQIVFDCYYLKNELFFRLDRLLVTFYWLNV